MNVLPLITEGRVELPMPGISINVDRLINGFIDLIESTTNCRKDWVFHLPGDPDTDPDSGLVQKRVKEGADEKTWFHYRPILLQQLQEWGTEITPAQNSFLHQCDQFYHLMKLKAEQVLRELDLAMPGYNFLEGMLSIPEHLRHVLRFLYYEPWHERMAKAHDDKNFLTLAVADSRPGLHFMQDRDLYQFKKDQILAFTGLKAEIATEGRLKSMAHYVDNFVLGDPRWSIVHFSHVPVQLSAGEIKQIINHRKKLHAAILAAQN
ncbi:MAG TPA: 2OG-Fe(II) oxygenase family protein [Patescibacteria group bacterium]|jgi:isopenicillin N synthase-like dioxygenase|nr:2OG-Fe(II) oxygenase family protein [Patescibacteria group bacterium]